MHSRLLFLCAISEKKELVRSYIRKKIVSLHVYKTTLLCNEN